MARVAVLACAWPVAHAQTPPSPPVETLPPVTVTSPPIPTQPGALRDDLVKTETINAREMQQSGATNLTSLLTHRPGIDVQVECSVCNVRNITLNNLPGRYTTLMLDGVPIFSSVSNAYGLDMVGLVGLERVDISRGAGTSLVAPESLAGTVNLVTRRPSDDAVALDVRGGSFGLRRATGYASKTFDGLAIAANATVEQHHSVDAVGSGISQFTGYDRKLGGFSLFVDDVGGFKVKSRVDLVNEKRMGGPLGDDYNAVRASTSGNPFDFSRGPHGSPDADRWVDPSTGRLLDAYDDGRFGLAQIIFTRRTQWIGSADRKLDGDANLHLAAGYAEHKQDSWYGGDASYFGRQKQYYGEASLRFSAGDTTLTTGLAVRYEDLHSRSTRLDIPDAPERIDFDAYTYRTPGVFVQAYRTFFDEALELNASLRQDHNNVYGNITTPRVNALWHHSDTLSSRLSAGTGYRLPTSFFELEHAILSAPAVDRSQAKPEKSNNLSYALNYADDRLSVTGSLNHTVIKRLALFVDDSANSGNFLLEPAASDYTINNADVVGTWQLTPADALTVGIEFYRYRFKASDFQGSLFARPEQRLNLAWNRVRGPWEFNAAATWTGPQDLAKFYDYGATQRYNLDGSAKPDRSPSFWVVDLHAGYQWSKAIKAYAGVNNLFNYRQADKDSFLWTDASGALDVTHIWGPSLGRALSFGMTMTF